MKKFIVLLALLALGVSLIGLVGAGQEQEAAHPGCFHYQTVYRYQYAVKVVQGESNPVGTEPQDPLSPSLYFTSANVHSPWSCQCVCFRVKLAVAGHFGKPGPITGWFYFECLKPDAVTEFDGEDFTYMLSTIGVSASFYEGYFVIESEDELDVVGVYTVTNTNSMCFQPVAMHQERVPARRIEVCGSLVAGE